MIWTAIVGVFVLLAVAVIAGVVGTIVLNRGLGSPVERRQTVLLYTGLRAALTEYDLRLATATITGEADVTGDSAPRIEADSSTPEIAQTVTEIQDRRDEYRRQAARIPAGALEWSAGHFESLIQAREIRDVAGPVPIQRPIDALVDRVNRLAQQLAVPDWRPIDLPPGRADGAAGSAP